MSGSAAGGCGVAERMLVAMARAVRDGEVVGQGVNSVLPSLAIALAKRTHAPRAISVNISGGLNVVPQPVPDSSAAPQWTEGSPVILANADFYDLVLGGRVDTFFASGAQIDGRGRINLSVIGPHDRPRVRLPGAGGLPVIFQAVRRVVLWRAKHTPRIFVRDVDFVSAAGNVDQVITPLCIFRMEDGRLRLQALFPGVDLDEVRARTGFPVEPASGGVQIVDPPAPDELRALEELDPGRHRDLDFR